MEQTPIDPTAVITTTIATTSATTRAVAASVPLALQLQPPRNFEGYAKIFTCKFPIQGYQNPFNNQENFVGVIMHVNQEVRIDYYVLSPSNFARLLEIAPWLCNTHCEVDHMYYAKIHDFIHKHRIASIVKQKHNYIISNYVHQ